MQQLKTIDNVKPAEEGGRRYGPKELFQVCGLDDLLDFDQAAGGTTYAKMHEK